MSTATGLTPPFFAMGNCYDELLLAIARSLSLLELHTEDGAVFSW